MWIWPLYLHVNKKSDDDDDDTPTISINNGMKFQYCPDIPYTEDPHYNDGVCYERVCCKIFKAILKIQKTYVFLKNNMGISMKKHTGSADFCADQIDFVQTKLML